jgi:hypothetical protein
MQMAHRAIYPGEVIWANMTRPTIVIGHGVALIEGIGMAGDTNQTVRAADTIVEGMHAGPCGEDYRPDCIAVGDHHIISDKGQIDAAVGCMALGAFDMEVAFNGVNPVDIRVSTDLSRLLAVAEGRHWGK